MPGVPATGSTTIAVLDSKIVADLCAGKFYVDATPTIYIGSGKTQVLGANVQITNPFGVIVKPYGANYEIAPALSGGMDAVIAFNIPTQAGNYQYGQYYVDVMMFDDEGSSWVVTKPIKICVPDKNIVTRNYGSLSASIRGICKDGKVYIIVDGVPNYNGSIVESQTNSFKIEYPTSSELDPLETTQGYLSLKLYEGVWKVTGEVCATYNYGDNVFVKIKYKIKAEKKVMCIIDECCVFTQLALLHKNIREDCTQSEKDNTASIVLDALRLLKTAQLAADCGEDPSEYVADLEALLGCKCTCNCNEGVPLIPVDPSKDFVIEGCNVSKVSAGLTDTYTIENYEYNVAVTPNGGVIVISDPVLSDCTKIQTLTFSISAAYEQIKTLSNQNNTEADFWASIINKALRGLNPACLGLTADQWNNKTLYDKIKAITDKMCACCGSCGAIVTVGVLTRSGSDVVMPFTYNEDTYRIDIYLDGIFQTAILATDVGSGSYTFVNAADGIEHTYTVIPRCSDKADGTPVEDTFIFLGCGEVAMPAVSTDAVTGAACPFDLTSLPVSAPPIGTTYEWHTANVTSLATLVANPESVVSGIYFLFAKNAAGCYSSGQQVTVICAEGDCCTAPILSKYGASGSNTVILFQSAACPPPGNSYTVKRKLASDPDVDGSYTTIGTPVWNATLNRWEMIDTTASNNVLYTYKIQSNCGGSPATTPYTSFDFARVTCPSVNFTPGYENMAYSFTPLGGSIDKYEVKIYDSTGATLIHTNTHTPAFSNPITGNFMYLTGGTDYRFEVFVWIGGVNYRICDAGTQTTLAP